MNMGLVSVPNLDYGSALAFCREFETYKWDEENIFDFKKVYNCDPFPMLCVGSKITCKIAADYLGISPMAVSIGMRNDFLPIGFAIHNEERDRTYSESWSYHIIGERLIAYKYGKTSEVQVQNIEKSLNTIIEQFEEMKKDLVFLLSENEDQQN